VRDNGSRKLDRETMDSLPLRAVNQIGQRAHPEEVAAALSLHCKMMYA
jgi:hypothetical protein